MPKWIAPPWWPAGYSAAELGLVVPLEEYELAAGHGDVASGREAADPMMDVGPRRHVADVDKTVVGEVRVECHADEPALPGLSTSTERKGSDKSVSILDHPKFAGLLADEDPAVGGDGQGRSRR